MAEAKTKNKLNRLIFTLKLIFGCGLLAALLIWNNNVGHLMKIFRSIQPEFIILLFVVGIALNWISCLKWKLFIDKQGFKVTIYRLLGLYFIGKFFSNFIPSMVGGDLTRTYLLGRQINSQSKSFASVFLERFTGLIALIVLALTFAITNPQILKEPKIGVSIALVSVAFIIFTILLLNPKGIDWISSKLDFVPFLPSVMSNFKTVQKEILYFKDKYRLLSGAMLYSFAFHLLTSLNVYLCCLSIKFYPAFLDIAVITPIILLLNTIPVSPNNIGWWEWTFSFLLVEAGTGSAEGLAVALILRGMTLIFSLAGGVFFLLQKHNKGSYK
jgi:uncharacterized protein (TIRG00374 family)